MIGMLPSPRPSPSATARVNHSSSFSPPRTPPSTGVIKRSYPHRLDENTYAATVTLHEDYTNFESIPNIMRISHGDNLTLLYAQPKDPSGTTYPDPDKATKWF